MRRPTPPPPSHCRRQVVCRRADRCNGVVHPARIARRPPPRAATVGLAVCVNWSSQAITPGEYPATSGPRRPCSRQRPPTPILPPAPVRCKPIASLASCRNWPAPIRKTASPWRRFHLQGDAANSPPPSQIPSCTGDSSEAAMDARRPSRGRPRPQWVLHRLARRPTLRHSRALSAPAPQRSRTSWPSAPTAAAVGQPQGRHFSSQFRPTADL